MAENDDIDDTMLMRSSRMEKLFHCPRPRLVLRATLARTIIEARAQFFPKKGSSLCVR